MIAAIWKSAALAGVIGVGCGGVYYVQRDLATTSVDPGKFGELDPGIHGEPADALTTADPVGITSDRHPAGEERIRGRPRWPSRMRPRLGSADEPPANRNTRRRTGVFGRPACRQGPPGRGRTGRDRDRRRTRMGRRPEAKRNGSGRCRTAPRRRRGGLPGCCSEGRDQVGRRRKSVGRSRRHAGSQGSPPRGPPRTRAKSSTSSPIPDEAGPVAGAADNKLTALPAGHPGPVLMEVPDKSARPRHVAEDLFLPDIGGQSEPISAQPAAGPAPGADALAAAPQEIQQVQNELPEIRPARSRSSIPTANNARPRRPSPRFPLRSWPIRSPSAIRRPTPPPQLCRRSRRPARAGT